jgi:hypothetical protein
LTGIFRVFDPPGEPHLRPLPHFVFEVQRWRTGRFPEWRYKRSFAAGRRE